MRTVSAQFLEAVRYSHMVTASCELHLSRQAEPVAVPVESGTVTIDRTAESRRTGHITDPLVGRDSRRTRHQHQDAAARRLRAGQARDPLPRRHHRAGAARPAAGRVGGVGNLGDDGRP